MAVMSSPAPVRLLIADGSENRAHEVDSALRNMGISTRMAIAEDPQARVMRSKRAPSIYYCCITHCQI